MQSSSHSDGGKGRSDRTNRTVHVKCGKTTNCLFFFFFLLCFSAAHCVLSIAVFSLPVPRMCDLILSSSANIIQSSGRGAKFLRMLHIS